MRLILCLLTFIALPAFAESIGEANAPVAANSPLMKLLGTVAYQDGPNCMNATAYVHGFVDKVTTVAEFEFDFYLKNFCHLNTGAAKNGDIFVRYNGKTMLHTATLIGPDTIFEKASLSGRNSSMNPDFLRVHPEESDYSTKRMGESRWFNGTTGSGTIRVYRCEPSEKVREKILEMQTFPAVQMAERIKSKLQSISLSPDKFSWLENDRLRRDLNDLSVVIGKLDGRNLSHRYAAVLADSIEVHASYFPKPHPPEMLWAIMRLRHSVKQLLLRTESTSQVEASNEP